MDFDAQDLADALFGTDDGGEPDLVKAAALVRRAYLATGFEDSEIVLLTLLSSSS